MSVALIFKNKDVHAWHQMLKAKLPDDEIEIYPDIRDKNDVDFIVCWRPAQGIFREFPNLKAVQSVGAPVDHILNTQDISKGI